MKRMDLFEDHWKNSDDESKTAKMQLKSIIDQAQSILDSLENDKQLDAWVQSKLALAEDYIQEIKKYLSYEMDSDQNNGELSMNNQDDIDMVSFDSPDLEGESDVDVDTEFDDFETEEDNEFILPVDVKDTESPLDLGLEDNEEDFLSSGEDKNGSKNTSSNNGVQVKNVEAVKENLVQTFSEFIRNK